MATTSLPLPPELGPEYDLWRAQCALTLAQDQLTHPATQRAASIAQRALTLALAIAGAPCPACAGSGMVPTDKGDRPCLDCLGSGETERAA
jgi:hypothetical protein